MFDFGFSEIIMIMVIALIVVGPERLPGLARTAGLWVGKAKRFVADVKSEIDQELSAEQLKKTLSAIDPGHAAEKLEKTLNEQDAFQDVYDIIEETKQVGQEIKQAYNETEADSEPEPAPENTGIADTTADNKNNKNNKNNENNENNES